MTLKEFLTPAEVASKLNVSRSFVYKLMRENRMDFIKVGRLKKIPPKEVERYIQMVLAKSQNNLKN